MYVIYSTLQLFGVEVSIAKHQPDVRCWGVLIVDIRQAKTDVDWAPVRKCSHGTGSGKK